MQEWINSLKGVITILSVLGGVVGVFFIRWLMAMFKNTMDKAENIIVNVNEIKTDIKDFKKDTKENFTKIETQIERVREESQKGDIINQNSIKSVEGRVNEIEKVVWKHIGAHNKDDHQRARNKTSDNTL